MKIAKLSIVTKKRGKICSLFLILLLLLINISYSKEENNFKPKLSFKLKGKFRYMNIGDVNKHLESFDDYVHSHLFYYKGGDIKKINNYGTDLEGELILSISSKFAISVGMGYIYGKSKSDFQTVGTFPFQTPFVAFLHEFVLEPKVKAIPIKMGIYYTLPLISRINLFLNSGFGYYFTKAYLYKYHKAVLLSEFIPGPIEIYNEYDVSSNGLGFHGGIGFEYNITKYLAFAIEFQGRYIKIKKLKGNRIFSHSLYPYGGEEGNLYIGERDMTDEGYGKYCPDLIISPSNPSGDEFQNINRAILDLSGYSLALGIKIKLF